MSDTESSHAEAMVQPALGKPCQDPPLLNGTSDCRRSSDQGLVAEGRVLVRNFRSRVVLRDHVVTQVYVDVH
jgi:hypothetical protein